MKVSKYGKTYDTADGSEQHFEDPKAAGRLQVKHDLRSDALRWQDDGGPINAAPASTRTPTPSKPAWSVLSLRAMKGAVADWLKGNPACQQQATERDEATEKRAVAVARNRTGAVQRDRYRNAWENT